jgi:DNA-binding CsgD family transcriptional regulator
MFHSHDITLDRFLEAGENGGWVGVRQDLIPDQEMDRSLFYNDFMRARNVYHQAGLNLGKTGSYPHAGISLLRPRAAGEFEEETVQLLRLLAPHFAQGFLLHQRMAALAGGQVMHRAVLQRTDFALIAVDGNGIVQNDTAAARVLAEKCDGILVRDGRVHASQQHEDKKLQELIYRAAQVGAGICDPTNLTSPGSAMLISRRPPLRPLQVVVTPFHSDSVLLEGFPCAVIFLTDPDAKPLPRGLVLRQLYQLTPSEAYLVDWLVRGLDVKQAAERMRITENSARSLLKCVFRKTGVGSQSALMRMVLNLPSTNGTVTLDVAPH